MVAQAQRPKRCDPASLPVVEHFHRGCSWCFVLCGYRVTGYLPIVARAVRFTLVHCKCCSLQSRLQIGNGEWYCSHSESLHHKWLWDAKVHRTHAGWHAVTGPWSGLLFRLRKIECSCTCTSFTICSRMFHAFPPLLCINLLICALHWFHLRL